MLNRWMFLVTLYLTVPECIKVVMGLRYILLLLCIIISYRDFHLFLQCGRWMWQFECFVVKLDKF